MKLYNVNGTANDKPNSGCEWIEVWKKVLESKGKDTSSIGPDMVGAHMNDDPNSNTAKYIGAIKQGENNKRMMNQLKLNFMLITTKLKSNNN